jgi:WD40 repeat protein
MSPILHYIENKYALVCYSVKVDKEKEHNTRTSKGINRNTNEHKLLAIDLNNLTTKKMKMKENIRSSVYLDNGILILGGLSISTWNTDKWPFERIKSRMTRRRPVNLLVPLSGDLFASSFDKIVTIWDINLRILHSIYTKQNIVELKVMSDGALLILHNLSEWDKNNCNLLFYNFRNGELLKKKRIVLPSKSLVVTSDGQYLVMIGENKVLFYHLLGDYVYAEFEMSQCHQFQNEKGKELKNMPNSAVGENLINHKF